MGLINLWTQVRKQLRLYNGGTGNTQGLSYGIIKVCTNRTGSSIAVGSLVNLTLTFNDGRIEKCNATTDVPLGVVVGYWATDDPDTLIFDDCPDAHTAAVMTHGTVRVNIVGTVTRGQYAFPSTTAGSASGSSTLGSGAFGIFQSSGTTGNTALVLLTGTQGAGTGAATSFGTPSLTLGTTNGAGVATTALRTDATILAFDATTPAASPLGGSGSVGAATVAARRDHVHAVTGALDDLSNVTAPSPTSGDVLYWNGSAWVDQAQSTMPNIWRPLMDGAIPGEIILDSGTGEAIMAYGPA